MALAFGMAGSFAVLGLAVTAFGPAIGLDADRMAQIGAGLMVAFGLILLIPRLNAGLCHRHRRVSPPGPMRRSTAPPAPDWPGRPPPVPCLGAVWSPCIGPTLGGAIGLASQGQGLAFAGAIMLAFGLGVASVMLALAYGARATLLRRRAALMRLAQRAQGRSWAPCC